MSTEGRNQKTMDLDHMSTFEFLKIMNQEDQLVPLRISEVLEDIEEVVNVLVHALPNAMLPMVTVIATSLGFIVSGAIQTETVFTWPGVGTLLLKALVARDYPLLQGSFIITSFAVVTANFLADIVYMYIDPRIKYE